MYYSLMLVTGIAFSCSTEFIPEINQKLKFVTFPTEFKITITTLMIIDYAACWLIENVLKYLFSDYRPKDIALRRPDQILREKERLEEEKREEILRVEMTREAAGETKDKVGMGKGTGMEVGMGKAEGRKDKEREKKLGGGGSQGGAGGIVNGKLR